MPIVTKVAVLPPGPREKFTGILGAKFRFTNGRLTIRGDHEWVDRILARLVRDYKCTIEEEARHGQRSAQTPSVPDPQHPLRGGVQPGGEGTPKEAPADGTGGVDAGQGDAGLRSERDRYEDARLDRLRTALGRLNPTNPKHWTITGLPKVSVVAKLARLEDVSRREVERAAPGFIRGGSFHADD